MQYSQEHLKTMVYAEFGGQTECIMGNWKIENRAFLLRCPATMQIYWNKRKRFHKKRVQFPQDQFGTTTWPRHVKMLDCFRSTQGKRRNLGAKGTGFDICYRSLFFSFTGLALQKVHILLKGFNQCSMNQPLTSQI